MATWDSRDPRWHVEDRKDGSNVNGWHWEERNREAWSRQRLGELLGSQLPPAQVDAALGHASITAVRSCTGEVHHVDSQAYQTMRKGNKVFAVFDLCITLDWKGRWLETDNEVKGDIVVTEFCSENEPDEYEIAVNVTGDGTGEAALKAAISGLRPVMLERLQQFVAELNALPV